MPKRPIVLLSLIIFVKIYFLLEFPSLLLYVLLIDAALSALLLIFSAKTRYFPAVTVLCIAFLTSSLITGYSYKTNEIKAKDYCDTLSESGITEYTATVDSFQSYGSYATVFVTLKNTDIKARLGTYSGVQLMGGDEIVFEGIPVFVSDIENKDFNTRDYLRSKKVFLDFPSASVSLSSGSSNISLLYRLKNHIKDTIYKYVSHNNNYGTSAFCYAVFTGDKNLLPDDLNDTFSRCGLTHLLCVSGMHLAILAGACYCLLSAFSLHKRTRCAVVIILCVFYTIFTGFSLSTVRACIMCSVSYIGIMLGRKTDVYRSLFLSLLVICILSPYSVLDISLQLSFCATLGIACVAEFIPDTKNLSTAKRIAFTTAAMLFSNLGAVIFTMPISAAYFGGISIMSAISTLVVSFVFEIVLTGILVLILISPLSAIPFFIPVMKFSGAVLHNLSLAIINIANFFSSFRYASVTAHFSAIYALVFIVLLCILSFFISFGKKKSAAACIAAILTIGILFSALSLIFSVKDDRLYNLTYYRKNENNRQLSVKLGTEGFLLINADSSLCTEKGHFMFDEFDGKNYLLIVPDKQVDAGALANDIAVFYDRFGLAGVFVTNTDDGALLAQKLSGHGIHCAILPSDFSVSGINMSYYYNNGFVFTADDGIMSTAVLFADDYKQEFLCGYDIAAFFTRKTKNQFDISQDCVPDCDVFFTRLKKDEKADSIINTNGEKYITIKG